MTGNGSTDDAVQAFRAGRIGRRQFVQRLAAAGLSSGVIAALLTACGGGTPSTPGAASGGTTGGAIPTTAPAPTAAVSTSSSGILKAPEPSPKRGGTLRMAFGVTISNYDIHQGGSSSVLCHMYNGLVRRDPTDGLKTIIPELAERWESTPDGLSWTFKLRSGVKFHNGTPFGADDVVATFNRIIFPPQGMSSQLKDQFPGVSKVEAVDPTTVRFSFKEPQANFLLVLTAPTSIIYSKQSLDENGQDLRKVIAPGTGAFVYKDYKQAERWVFERNPNYWSPDLPYLDGLELIHVPAFSDRGTAVLTGQADLSWNVSKETFDEGQQRRDTIGANRVGNFGAYWVLINVRKKPFDDPRVRRAMHLVLSRQNLFQAFRTQEQMDLSRWLPRVDDFAMPRDEIAKLPGYREDKGADIAEAKKLMADAGFANGIPDVELLSASLASHAEILAPAVQDQLKRQIGIDAKIRVVERSLLAEEERGGRFTLVLDTYGGPISDFSPIGNSFFKTGAAQNFGGYSNPQFDDLLRRSDAELDRAKRADLLKQVQEVLDGDPPWLLIGYTDHLLLWRNSVKGVSLDQRLQSEWNRVETAFIDR